MKNFMLRIPAICCILSLLSLSAKAQTGLPSIGSVYNYAQGDSFLFKLTDINTNQVVMYVSRAVLSRDDSHYPDSIIYSIEESFLDTNGLNPEVWDTVRKVFYNCNDTIFPYNGFISCQENTDSCYAMSAISTTTDSLFPGTTVYHADFGCGWWNSGWNNAAEGLGIVHAYTACGDFVLEQYDILMVHYYKAPVGIPHLTDDGPGIHLFPNPATNSIIITAHEKMSGSRFTILDMTGKIIMTAKLPSPDYLLPLTDIANGVYFITFENNAESSTKKFIVSR